MRSLIFSNHYHVASSCQLVYLTRWLTDYSNFQQLHYGVAFHDLYLSTCQYVNYCPVKNIVKVLINSSNRCWISLFMTLSHGFVMNEVHSMNGIHNIALRIDITYHHLVSHLDNKIENMLFESHGEYSILSSSWFVHIFFNIVMTCHGNIRWERLIR